jgi:mRNA-degrading endonuclease toxin of MazEF toxin-antitoxin module
MDAGDIYLADLNDEINHRVLIVSSRQFHRLASRAIVVPELRLPPDDVPSPWRIDVDGTVFAVDMLRSVPVDRLVERVDRCTADTLVTLRRVLRHIT